MGVYTTPSRSRLGWSVLRMRLVGVGGVGLSRSFALPHVDQLSYDVIGLEMGLSRAQIENTLERAKYHLRKLKTAGSI